MMPTLDLLPDTVRPRPQDIAPTNTVVLEHICFYQDLEYTDEH